MTAGSDGRLEYHAATPAAGVDTWRVRLTSGMSNGAAIDVRVGGGLPNVILWLHGKPGAFLSIAEAESLSEAIRLALERARCGEAHDGD